MNNIEVDRISEFNLFGVIVNEHITWKPLIELIRVEISRITGILRKLQCTLRSSILLVIYSLAYITYYLYYLITVCAHKDPIVTEKKVVCVVTNRPYIAHNIPI